MSNKCSHLTTSAVILLSLLTLAACKPSSSKSEIATEKQAQTTTTKQTTSKTTSPVKQKSKESVVSSASQQATPQTNIESEKASPANTIEATTSTQEVTEIDAISTSRSIVSPGAAAGLWQSVGTGNITHITSDGYLEGTNYFVSGVSEATDGHLDLFIGSERTGFTFAYYPAGVKIPIRIATIVGDEVVFETVEDPTDSSRDRMISGNGNYLDVTQEQYDDYLSDVYYRP